MTDSPQIVLCTVPDRSTADSIAAALVADRLAACVNIVDNITSVYRWQGNIERDNELLLIVKSSGRVFGKLERRILELHPYELPEIIAVPVEAGHAGYLDWLKNCLE